MANKLPSRIAFVVIATVLLFLGSTAASIVWMTRALDRQAQDQSETQVGIAQANLLARVRMVTLDYAKWDAAHDAVYNADLAWLYENVGSSASIGEVVQMVIVWGGGLENDVGWVDDGVVEPRSGFLDASVLTNLERSLEQKEPSEFASTEFFEWRGDELFVIGSSRIEGIVRETKLPDASARSGGLLMGIRVSEEVVQDIAHSLTLIDARIMLDQPSDRPSLALTGLDGKPVAFITWELPRPGTVMLGRMLPLLLLVSAVSAALAILNMSLVRRSARNLVLAEQRASSAARTDALTGLPNRLAFNEALERPVQSGERALLFLDLNDFKTVNDSLGHAAGDHVINCAAQRLSGVCGKGTILARIAGDEFVLMIECEGAEQAIKDLAEVTYHAFDAPFEFKGHHLHLTAAIGYAVQDTKAMSCVDLMRQADLAMYESKRQKEREPVAFRTMIEEASRRAFRVERALRVALTSRPEEFSVAYQPIVALDGQMQHAEALARWTSLEEGLIEPSKFIAVAEKAGLIIELGRLIFAQVVKDLLANPRLFISINISPHQLMSPGFLQEMIEELERNLIDPKRIEVELTESVLVKKPALAAQSLKQFRAAGFCVALDDFGTGYSSVSYLETMVFDTLKIDRSFVAGIHAMPKRRALLRAMIQMAHDLDLRVVGEGVESNDDLEMLRQFDCDLVQGYHISRPLPIGDLHAFWAPTDEAGAAA
jgi:diguanylate cyclase (GGDEF)-like protein